jgi:hypothetical protein
MESGMALKPIKICKLGNEDPEEVLHIQEIMNTEGQKDEVRRDGV